MSFHEVKALGVTFRPIDVWPGAETRYRRHAPFTAHFGSTMALLGRVRTGPHVQESFCSGCTPKWATCRAPFRYEGSA